DQQPQAGTLLNPADQAARSPFSLHPFTARTTECLERDSLPYSILSADAGAMPSARRQGGQIAARQASIRTIVAPPNARPSDGLTPATRNDDSGPVMSA